MLSSRVHVVWALAQGGTLEDRPRYNKSRCFETFPFPVATPEQQARITDLAEQLDALRKRVLAEHAELTLTGLYNVLAKVGDGGTAQLTAKERATYDNGLVAVLKSFHDDLDAAVFEAYGWHDQPDEQTLLVRLVQLNTDRRAEEAQGHIRWLRPEFQAPPATITLPFKGKVASATFAIGRAGEGMGANSGDSSPIPLLTSPLKGEEPDTLALMPIDVGRVTAWPATLPEQVAALANALTTTPQSESQLSARFTSKGKLKNKLPELLTTLATLGRARQLEDGRWIG